MSANEYLKQVLNTHLIDQHSIESKELENNKGAVTRVLQAAYSDAPVLRVGGSYAKGTMIRDKYDLDILCYFQSENNSAGETLKEIFENVKESLSDDYFIEEKRSALKIQSKEKSNLHIDVVPGRFFDDSQVDAFLYQSEGEKERLKTNPDIHIKIILDSGQQDTISLMKLWAFRWQVPIKTFVLELMIVKLLDGMKGEALEKRLAHLMVSMSENIDSLFVEDPANPNNDLSILWNDSVKSHVKNAAQQCYSLIETGNWSAIFGEVNIQSTEEDMASAVNATPHKSVPYAC